MEKSAVQDLNSSRGVRKSAITTSFQDKSLDLRRSKICNLPSYKKSDMSDRIPFVVIFQTI